MLGLSKLTSSIPANYCSAPTTLMNATTATRRCADLPPGSDPTAASRLAGRCTSTTVRSVNVHAGRTRTGFVDENGFWLAFRDSCTVGDLRWETDGTEGGTQLQTMGQPRRIECCAARRNSAT